MHEIAYETQQYICDTYGYINKNSEQKAMNNRKLAQRTYITSLGCLYAIHNTL